MVQRTAMKATIYKKIIRLSGGERQEIIYFDENGSFTDEHHAVFCLIRRFNRSGRLKSDEWSKLKDIESSVG